MFRLSKLPVYFVLLIAIISFYSCKQRPGTPDHLLETIDQSAMEYASMYVCPMHCKGSGSHEAGKCPVCTMDYVKNSNYQDGAETDSTAKDHTVNTGEENTSEFKYACPMHPEIVGVEGENCSICGMDLVALNDEGADDPDH